MTVWDYPSQLCVLNKITYNILASEGQGCVTRQGLATCSDQLKNLALKREAICLSCLSLLS